MRAREEGELSQEVHNEKIVELLKTLENSVENITSNSFLSNKVFPMYHRNDKDYGAFISVGDAFLARLNNDVIEIMDKKDEFNELSFEKYVETLINLMHHIWKEQDLDDVQGEVLYLGYCVDKEEYFGYKVKIVFKKNEEPDVTSQQLSGFTFEMVGDNDVVSRMILGFQKGLPDQIDGFMRAFFARMIEDCFDDKNLKEHYVTKMEHLAVNAWNFNEEQWGEIKKGTPDHLYNPEEDKMRMDKYIDLAIRKVVNDIISSVRSGASVDYIINISLRECLQLINWLIDSTSKFHSFIKAEVPTVGGDVYIATITAKEGFKFRKLDEYF